MKRKLVTHSVAFLAGIVLAFGWFATVHWINSRSQSGRAVEAMKRWGTFIDKDGLLAIPVRGQDGPGLQALVRIRLFPREGDTENADIEVLRNEVGATFKLRWKGPYGRPQAQYSGGPIGPIVKGHSWIDCDADGLFDEHYDYAAKGVSVRTQGGWVRATTIIDGVATTAEGQLVFDPDRGEWRPRQEK